MHHTNNNNITTTFKRVCTTQLLLQKLDWRWQWPLLLFTWAIIIVYLTPQLTQRPRIAMYNLSWKIDLVYNIITLLLSTFPRFYVTWHHFLYHEIDIGSLSSLQTYILKSIQEFNSRVRTPKTYYFFIPFYSWTLTISCPFFIFVYRDCKSLLCTREISTKQ